MYIKGCSSGTEGHRGIFKNLGGAETSRNRDEATQDLWNRPRKEAGWGIYRYDDSGDDTGWSDNP
jgi:hypothetical protein